ncbi:hypothetical protein MSG28_009402 [Choristoneura fumiferana]|uniref:Uncharacterized protein n=1 Tax=Choristoneura fumiferana TaxID=7141 RepID=A0ACC0KXS4_CHOFU|nr:hypothetical protein MSG28_009402 [Choristoneura fumiferana]
MDHYLTTYRKDYLWPNLPGSGGGEAMAGRLLSEELAFYQACMQHSRPPDCRCPQYSGGQQPQLPPGKEGGWSRNEIMGPLLDPKLYPVKVGASPETDTSRYDQPNAFLDKLQSKYPMLYSILQNEASPELKQRIDRDRNKTTYQVDFCESGPGAKFEGLQRAADDSGTGPCAQPMRLPGDPCRVAPKQRIDVVSGTASRQDRVPRQRVQTRGDHHAGQTTQKITVKLSVYTNNHGVYCGHCSWLFNFW